MKSEQQIRDRIHEAELAVSTIPWPFLYAQGWIEHLKWVLEEEG